jgi:hypothetical protein
VHIKNILPSAQSKLTPSLLAKTIFNTVNNRGSTGFGARFLCAMNEWTVLQSSANVKYATSASATEERIWR